MSRKTFNLSLPAKLIQEIDEAAKADYCTRSDFIREAVVARLQKQKARDNPTGRQEQQDGQQPEQIQQLQFYKGPFGG